MINYKTLVYIFVICFAAYQFLVYTVSLKFNRTILKSPPALAAASAAICLLSPGFPIAVAASLALPVLFVRTTAIISCAYLSALLLSPNAFDSFTIIGINGFTFSLQMGLSLGFFLAGFASRQYEQRKSITSYIPAAILVVMLYFIGARGTNASNWLREFISLTLMWIVPFLITGRISLEPHKVYLLKLTLIGCGTVLAFIAIFEAGRRWPLYSAVDQQLGLYHRGFVIKLRDGLLRARGPLSDQTDLGFILVIGLAAATSFTEVFKQRLAQMAAVAAILAGIYATQSRGALLGAAIVFISLFTLSKSGGRLGRVVLGCILVAAIYLTYSYFHGSNNYSDQTTIDYRVNMLNKGIELFMASPFSGYTYGDVVALMPEMKQGEGIVDIVNSYLYFSLMLGVFGLLGFALFLFVPIFAAERSSRRADSQAIRELGTFCFASLSASAVMYIFTSLVPRATILVVLITLISMRTASSLKTNRES